MKQKTKNPHQNRTVKAEFSAKTVRSTFAAFGKVFKSEFRAQFSIAIIIGIIITSLLPLISPLASGSLNGNPVETYRQVSQVMGQTVIYALIIRVVIIFREKTSVDRNRALYLRYGKNSVLFGKTIVEAITFILSVVIVALLGTMISVRKNDGVLPSGFAGNLVAYIFAILFLYAVMATGVKWALASVNRKEMKGLVIAAFLILTVGVYTVMSISEALVTSEEGVYPIMDTIQDNIYVFAFVPILNIAVIPMTISGRLDAWTVIPFIFECAIIIGLMWRSLAKNLKFYLAG